MNKFLLSALIINIFVIAPVAFFFHRDVIAQEKVETNLGCIPHEVKAVEVGKSSVKLEWITDDHCFGYLKYGTSPNVTDNLALGVAGYEATSEHVVDLQGLKPNETYYLVFYSNGELYGDKGKPFEIKTDTF